MAYNDSPDSEFDQEMERILQEHFDEEGSSLRAPGNPWEWLESRLEEPANPSFFSRLLGMMNPMREGRLSPAFAVAGVAVVAVAVAAVVWAMSGGGGPESPGGLAVAPVTEESDSASFATAAPAPTTMPRQVEVTRVVERELEEKEQAPNAMAMSEPTPVPAPAATTAPAAALAATEAPAMVMGEDSEPTPYPAPAATAAPAPTITVMAMATPAPQAASDEMEVIVAVEVEKQEPLAVSAAGPAGPAGAAGPQVKAASSGPPDTTFRNYQRQRFVETSEDNVSTFSLDTDRTSHHLALNWARSGYEVDPASVRAEEWVNAFDYQYDLPLHDDSFAITSDLFPHPLDENKRLARIAFQAPELVDDRPLNVTLVLDASGSMADGNRVEIAREAAESIRRSLRPNDRIAVVHFTVGVIRRYTVEHRPPDDYRVRDSISWLQPHGSTNVQAGLNLAVMMADEARTERPDAYNYIILMSDGVANVDATDPFAILETAHRPEKSGANARNPLRLITIGVGINNYNDVLLEQLAQHGNGWYRYLDGAAQAQATFSRENWLALSTPFADQTRAQVTWDTEVVERWRIVGYENRVTPDHTFTQDRKEFAELYSGAATTVFYELELQEGLQRLAAAHLGRVELRWVRPDTGESLSQSAALRGNLNSAFEGQDGSLARFGAIVALAADLYGGLPDYPEGAYAEVHQGLSDLQTHLRSLVGDLGRLDSYNDFSFLLDHIIDGLEERLPASTRSGYSR